MGPIQIQPGSHLIPMEMRPEIHVGMIYRRLFLKRLCVLLDWSEDGLFDLKDFTRLMTTHMKGQEEMEDELRESFKMFDLNGDGYVSFDELRTAMLTLGEPMTDEEVKELFKLCDLNKDGRIDYEGIPQSHITQRACVYVCEIILPGTVCVRVL